MLTLLAGTAMSSADALVPPHLVPNGQIGAERLFDINPGEGGSNPQEFTAFGGWTYFAAGPYNDRTLWRTDGRSTTRVPGVGNTVPRSLKVFNGQLFFGGTGGSSWHKVWRTDGTTTVKVADVRMANTGRDFGFTAVGGRLYFPGLDDNDDEELWWTDGVTTQRVADVNPEGSSFPGQLTPFGTSLYFAAQDVDGREVWRTDGIRTEQVADLQPGNQPSDPGGFTVLGDRLYFAASGPDYDIWRIDPTGWGIEGVAKVPWCCGGPDTEMIAFQNRLYVGNLGGDDAGVWQIDGPSVTRIATTLPRWFGWRTFRFTEFGGKLYFVLFTAEAGREMWRFDGHAVEQVTDNPPNWSGSNPDFLTVHGGKLYYVAQGPDFTPLWRTDGTVTEAVVTKTFHSGPSGPIGLTAANGIIFFSSTGPGGHEPWRIGDTTAPTLEVAVPAAGGVYSYGDQLWTDFTCVEPNNGSGLKSCSTTSLVDTWTVGKRTLTLTAMDHAGNRATHQVSYTVVPGPNGPPPTPRPHCAGLEATHIAKPGGAVVRGTSGPDVIVGTSGRDVIRGGGGNDVICAKAGEDEIFGGDGRDRVWGEGGADRISGGRGRDVLDSGAGRDRLDGGPGRDSCVNWTGKDILVSCP